MKEKEVRRLRLECESRGKEDRIQKRVYLDGECNGF